ncbi:Arginase/deacetylase [Zalerion maritima]|uniref:Arginase/deacetylase n=1 Tax=Zalerion maritima TaxID=339359 RepID=A0AAD5RM09_9PEZI|nr:Arginase/deacetylase [Zalerion maritima]
MESSGMTSLREREVSAVELTGDEIEGEVNLAHSLNQLSIASTARPTPPRRSSSTSTNTNTPRTQKSYASLQQQSNPVVRSPSRASLPPRSPSVSSTSRVQARSPLVTGGRESRSATPTLLRKASMNSLHSANGITPGRTPVRRTSSTNLRSPSANLKSPLHSAMPDLLEKPRPTASSIARDHFRGELDTHHRPGSLTNSETVVVLHDACYGHRYSRPRTSRAALSTIVERPERVRGTVLGVSLAYVLLGERHSDGLYAPHPQLEPAGIPDVPFLIRKSGRRVPLTSSVVTNVHGVKWMEELKLMCDAAESKLAMNGKELQRPTINRGSDHSSAGKFHEGDLYLCSESLDAMEGALGAVCDGVDEIFSANGPRRAYVAIRPPGHHCSTSWPSGFCWLNNVHVGIMHSILNHGLTHAAIMDFDLHHGDGSQAIAWTHNSRSVGLSKNAAAWKRTSIGYFSLHDINSYPCEMGDEEKVRSASLCIENAHGQNIWNVHLQPWKSETEFWELYEGRYRVILDKCKVFLKQQTDRCRALNQTPRATIFISAGFDASEWESSGMQRHNVNVPTDFYARITRDIVKLAAEEGTSVDGRVVSVMEGGYSERALFASTLSHLSGLAGDDPATKDKSFNGLGCEIGRRISTSRGRSPADSTSTLEAQAAVGRPYDPSWWAIGELEKFERTIAPPAPTPTTAPTRNSPPTYYSPTQSSSAKVSTPRVRRSVSGLSMSSNYSRPPSPPPPEVEWPVAAHELSKLLIPTDRATESCKHEELSAEATRIRRDRQSIVAQNSGTAAHVPERAPTRMALRERKPKPIIVDDGDKKGRRKTVAVVPSERPQSRTSVAPKRQLSRRLSAASTVFVSSPSEPAPSVRPVPGSARLPSPKHAPRPDSAMAGRPSGTNLAAKHTRVSAVKNEPVPKPVRASKRASPTRTKGPRSPTATKTPISPTASTARTSRSPPTKASDTGTADDSMDSLTAGMKKIKLTVLSKEQREARARERTEQEKLAKSSGENRGAAPPTPSETTDNSMEDRDTILEEPEEPEEDASKPFISPTMTSRRSSVKRLTRAFEDQSPKSQSGPPPNTTPPRQPTQNQVTASQRLSAMAAASNSELPLLRPASASSGKMPEQIPLPPTSSPTPGEFVQYQPQGPAPTSIPVSGPIHWAQPTGFGFDTVTPATTPGPTPGPTPLKRDQLPTFSSTGNIPFAAGPKGRNDN